MLLSFVIPMYNCAGYIAECIDSLLRQGLPEDQYELIVVNDGSTDHGAQIVDTYCSNHPNIRLINQSNQGVGAARNRGIELAQGEYIHFMDADDWLIDNSLSDIFRVIRENGDAYPDIITFGYQYVYESGKQVDCHVSSQYKYIGTIIESANRDNFIWMCANTLIRTDIARKYSFGSYKMLEDTDYMSNLYLFEDNLSVIEFDAKIYCYRQHNNSAIHNLDREFTLQTLESIDHLYHKVMSNCEGTGLTAHMLCGFHCALSYKAIFKLLCSRYTYRDYRKIIYKFTRSGLLPFPERGNYVYKTFNILSKSPLLLWIASPLYSSIYLRYFKKDF